VLARAAVLVKAVRPWPLALTAAVAAWLLVPWLEAEAVMGAAIATATPATVMMGSQVDLRIWNSSPPG
jgi:hypothetical protein